MFEPPLWYLRVGKKLGKAPYISHWKNLFKNPWENSLGSFVERFLFRKKQVDFYWKKNGWMGTKKTSKLGKSSKFWARFWTKKRPRCSTSNTWLTWHGSLPFEDLRLNRSREFSWNPEAEVHLFFFIETPYGQMGFHPYWNSEKKEILIENSPNRGKIAFNRLSSVSRKEPPASF